MIKSVGEVTIKVEVPLPQLLLQGQPEGGKTTEVCWLGALGFGFVGGSFPWHHAHRATCIRTTPPQAVEVTVVIAKDEAKRDRRLGVGDAEGGASGAGAGGP